MPSVIQVMLAGDVIFSIALLVLYRMLRELHLSMNSRLDLLLKTTGELARAEGFTAGQKDEQGQLAGLRRAGADLGSTG